MNPKKCMVVLSGGMDSATLLYHMLEEGFECEAVTVDYGQRHSREIVAARDVCESRGIKHHEVDFSELGQFLTGSSQTDSSVPVPHGHYEAEAMKATVVPNRNMVLLSIAASIAIARDCGVLAYGAHAGDHAIYPDCRPEFVVEMQRVLSVCHYDPLLLRVPFIALSKGDICIAGQELGVPYELTWTCYEGGLKACGKCGACQERLEAFKDAGVEDPIKYEEGVR